MKIKHSKINDYNREISCQYISQIKKLVEIWSVALYLSHGKENINTILQNVGTQETQEK